MKENPLLKLQTFGQSIWMDYIRRHMITSGELKQLIEEDGLRGVTSNPSIFEKAISGSHDYDDSIRAMALEGKRIEEIYQALTVEDIQRAADLFRPTYNRLKGRDGFVSLEVNPHLAHDTEGTISEARLLWSCRQSAERNDQSPCHPRGVTSNKTTHQRGDQCEHHTSLRIAPLSGSGRSLYRRA